MQCNTFRGAQESATLHTVAMADDDVNLPTDVDEHVEKLRRLLARIPDDYARRIYTGPGWYPILAELGAALLPNQIRADSPPHTNRAREYTCSRSINTGAAAGPGRSSPRDHREACDGLTPIHSASCAPENTSER